MIADGVPAFGWHGDAYWRDIGSPTAYLEAQMDLLDGRVRTPLVPPGERTHGNWIAARASVDRTATILAPSVIGAGVTIARGSHVGPLAVLGEDVRVEADARIERSVIWERTEIGAGAHLEGSVVGAAGRIGAGARLGAGTVLESGAVVAPHARLPART